MYQLGLLQKNTDFFMDAIWGKAVEKLRMETHSFLEHLTGLGEIFDIGKFQNLGYQVTIEG